MSENAVWSVAEAKARLSEVIDRALKQGPQAITKNGRPAVVLVSAEEWARKTGRKGTLAEFFAASPLRGAALELELERPQRRGARDRAVIRGWLIDTNIISEWVKPRPDPGVVRWLEESDEDRVFLSVVTLAEIRFGVASPSGAAALSSTAGSGRSCRSVSRAASWGWTGKSPTPAAACRQRRGRQGADWARWML